jgi:YqaJ-like viral recombinase domain
MFTAFGSRYEDEARQYFELVTGEKVVEFGLLLHPDNPWLAASPDGVTTSGKCVEIKVPMRRAIVSGEVPHHYIPQVQVQMATCGCHATYFIQYKPACMTPDRKPFLDITIVEFDKKWFQDSLPTLKTFWEEYMARKAVHVPDDTPPTVVTTTIVDGLYDDY